MSSSRDIWSLSSRTNSKNFIFRVQVREFGKNDRVRRVRVRSLGLYTVGPVVTVITSYIFSHTEFMFAVITSFLWLNSHCFFPPALLSFSACIAGYKSITDISWVRPLSHKLKTEQLAWSIIPPWVMISNSPCNSKQMFQDYLLRYWLLLWLTWFYLNKVPFE